MRVSELSNLNFGDLNIDENEIRVFGKGAKERIVLMSDRAKGYLVQYIKSARNLLAPGYEIGEITDDSPLFINNTGYRLQNKTIRKVINEIVFGEKLENANIEKWESNLNAGRYLSFCLKFAIANKIPLTHPPGMYYLIDNVRIKKAYQKENELRIQKEIKEEMKHEENTASAPVSVPVSVQVKATTQKGNTIGFGSILKGGK